MSLLRNTLADSHFLMEPEQKSIGEFLKQTCGFAHSAQSTPE
jgi:hypothetical protein